MFTIGQILKATGGSLVRGSASDTVAGVSTDSRTISAGDLFVALEGENFNGHNFIGDCFAKGAKCAVVRRGILSPYGGRQYAPTISGIIIEVADTLKALGDIAHFHRMRFKIPVIAITGSNGKTTTKDMAAQVLAAKYRVLKSQGTFNNLVGLPLTLLKLNNEHQACVLEMGTSRTGEIARLAQIAMPGTGVITNIGPSHLEFFKDLETVSQAKMELFSEFSEADTAIWNADESMLSGLYQILNCKKRTFGFSAGCDFRAQDVKNTGAGWQFTLNASRPLKIKLLGEHNIYNALAACAVGCALGVEYNRIYSALAGFNASSMRMEVLQAAGITIINDCYNSNPKSMESALKVLSGFPAEGRKILVSGDMLELGDIAGYFHHQLGMNVAGSGVDIFIGVGSMSEKAVSAAVTAGMNKDAARIFNDAQEAGRSLLDILRKGDVVLIKGSRAMRMEKVCSTIYSTR